MTSVEPDIDALYQQPLSAFTAARNALAKTLSGAEAHRIKRLAKPTLVPWTVNQLYWRARDVYDRVSATGRTLRDAQIAALKGRGVDLRRASADHRKAIADAVRKGGVLAAQGGAHPSADQLGRMLEALSLAEQPPERPGRLTELLQPSGFEALAGIAPAAVDRPQPSSRPSGTPAPRATGPRLVTSPPATPKPDPVDMRHRKADERRQAAQERKRQKAIAATRAKAERRVHTAERELARARDALSHAERNLAGARSAVQEAERKLATARGDRVLSSPHV